MIFDFAALSINWFAGELLQSYLEKAVLAPWSVFDFSRNFFKINLGYSELMLNEATETLGIKFFSPKCLFIEGELVLISFESFFQYSFCDILVTSFSFLIFNEFLFLFLLIYQDKIVFPGYNYPKLEQLAAYLIGNTNSVVVHQTSDKIYVVTKIKQQLGIEE